MIAAHSVISRRGQRRFIWCRMSTPHILHAMRLARTCKTLQVLAAGGEDGNQDTGHDHGTDLAEVEPEQR